MRNSVIGISMVVALPAVALVGGCPRGGETNPPGFENSTDKSNGGARLVGSSSCVQCHSEIAQLHIGHGHAHALKAAQGAPPIYPAAPNAGVPNPPPGIAWTE